MTASAAQGLQLGTVSGRINSDIDDSRALASKGPGKRQVQIVIEPDPPNAAAEAFGNGGKIAARIAHADGGALGALLLTIVPAAWCIITALTLWTLRSLEFWPVTVLSLAIATSAFLGRND